MACSGAGHRGSPSEPVTARMVVQTSTEYRRLKNRPRPARRAFSSPSFETARDARLSQLGESRIRSRSPETSISSS